MPDFGDVAGGPEGPIIKGGTGILVDQDMVVLFE